MSALCKGNKETSIHKAEVQRPVMVDAPRLFQKEQTKNKQFCWRFVITKVE